MQDNSIYSDQDTDAFILIWPSFSIAAAKPYIKALGVVTILLAAWAAMCIV